MNIEIKKLSEADIDKFKQLIFLFEDVFEMKDLKIPDNNHLQPLLKKDTFFVFVALFENNVVGGLTFYTLPQYYSEKLLAYIYDLAVKREFQRNEIGKKLIAATIDYCKEMDMEEVFVQAHAEDLHAIEFYRSTGAIAEKVVHFNYPLRVK
jgi:aminoglycoside 3-N-acetyltransferase I